MSAITLTISISIIFIKEYYAILNTIKQFLSLEYSKDFFITYETTIFIKFKMTQNFGRYTLDNRSYSEHKYFSPNHRCKLTQILVSPRSALKSPTSSHFAMFSDGSCSNHSCQSKYSILTSKSKVKNLLLDVGSEIRYRHDVYLYIIIFEDKRENYIR